MVPNQDEKSRKFQRVVGYDKHPLELEGVWSKSVRVGGRNIFWNNTFLWTMTSQLG